MGFHNRDTEAVSLSSLSWGGTGDLPADPPGTSSAHSEALQNRRDGARWGAVTERREEVWVYPETLNLPCFHAERCRLCQEKCRALFCRDCPYSSGSIVPFSKPEVVGIMQAQWKGRTQMPCFPSPTYISPEGKVPTYLPFCFSPVSFSQQLGSKAKDCDLFGDDSGSYFKAQVYKNCYSRKTRF